MCTKSVIVSRSFVCHWTVSNDDPLFGLSPRNFPFDKLIPRLRPPSVDLRVVWSIDLSRRKGPLETAKARDDSSQWSIRATDSPKIPANDPMRNS